MTQSKTLTTGQRVWIEHRNVFRRIPNSERIVHAYQIVKTSKTRAYVVRISELSKYQADNKKHAHLITRIVKQTCEIINDGIGDRDILWLSEEEFKADVRYEKDVLIARKKAHAIVDRMTLAGLENLIKKHS